MPAKGPSYDAVRAALDAQWDLLLVALDGADPAAPTGCAGWTVRDLHAHLTATTQGLARILEAPAPGRADTDVAGWAAALPGLAAVADEDARRTDPGLRPAVARARELLATADPERVVQQRTGAHRLADAVLFRLVEAVVHGLDLGVAPDRAALRLVVRALAGVLAAQVPGHSVEVRVPPYAVVQCVLGPRHTRGTPPSTVEADPVPFVQVLTGRLAWADAVADGRVRVRGERADLSAWLPVLR